MTTAASPTDDRRVERSLTRYRRWLVLFPAEFREEYGEDLVQGYRDLLVHAADGRGVGWRAIRDLVSSAGRERAAALRSRRPSAGLLIAVVLTLAVVVVVGAPLLLVPAVVLIGLPVYGLTRIWQAWTVRRTTGGPIAGHLAVGLAALVPAGVFVAVFGGDTAYWWFLAISGAAVLTAAAGIIWAVATVVRRRPRAPRAWARVAIVVVPSVAVLAFVIGASLNSYLRTIGPSGDHSVENASAVSRSLWVAAGAGDLAAVRRITATTCADPWVRYTADRHGNRENARGHAIVNGHGEVERVLDRYMDGWADRCGDG